MTKKQNTEKPPAKLSKQPPSAPPAPEYKLIDMATKIDSINAVLTFRNSDPAAINRPVDKEQAAFALAKELPAVKRWLPMREELARLQELVRTAQEAVSDAERRYEDATGDDDLVELAYQIDAARLQLKDERGHLERYTPLAAKAHEAARQAYAQFFTSETNKLYSQGKAAYDKVHADVVPQIVALVSRLAEAKVHCQTLTRFHIPDVGSVIGPAPSVPDDRPAEQPKQFFAQGLMAGAQ